MVDVSKALYLGLDQDAIGSRIARARKLRGFTQQQLADITPCSKSLIAQVERGHKPASPVLVAAVAAALHVELADLTGQPYRGGNRNSDRIHATIPQIRHALVYWDVPPELETPPRSISELAAEIARATKLRGEARYIELGEMLPRILLELAAICHQAHGEERDRAFRLLASAYSAVDSMAYKLGYVDLFHLAVERMRWAAGNAADPLLLSVADTRFSMAFIAEGAYRGGLTLLKRTSTRLQQETRGSGVGQAALAVQGTVHLRAAIIAARGNQKSECYDQLGAARETAKALGKDTRDYALLFGPTNTAIHEVAAAVELGDADEAIRRGANISLPGDFPAERTSHHFIDMGRAYLWAGKPEQALESVLQAERIAPQRTRYHPFARETIRALLDHRRQVPESLRGISRRMESFTNL